jgi:hypothetical protein
VKRTVTITIEGPMASGKTVLANVIGAFLSTYDVPCEVIESGSSVDIPSLTDAVSEATPVFGKGPKGVLYRIDIRRPARGRKGGRS